MRTALFLLAFGLLVFASPAWATFPGRNGVLAFSAYSLNEESSDIDIASTYVGIAHVPGGPRHIFAVGFGAGVFPGRP